MGGKRSYYSNGHVVHAIITGVHLYSLCATPLSGQSTELFLYDVLQLVLPPWPMYRKHALDWQKPRPEKTDTKKGGGKKKQK